MSTIVFDPLYIKTIEKAIGRKLDDFELEAIKFGEPIQYQNRKGEWASFHVPHYKFESLGPQIEAETSFFDFTFNVGDLKKSRS
jgi:hypothetical protein